MTESPFRRSSTFCNISLSLFLADTFFGAVAWVGHRLESGPNRGGRESRRACWAWVIRSTMVQVATSPLVFQRFVRHHAQLSRSLRNADKSLERMTRPPSQFLNNDNHVSVNENYPTHPSSHNHYPRCLPTSEVGSHPSLPHLLHLPFQRLRSMNQSKTTTTQIR